MLNLCELRSGELVVSRVKSIKLLSVDFVGVSICKCIRTKCHVCVMYVSCVPYGLEFNNFSGFSWWWFTCCIFLSLLIQLSTVFNKSSFCLFQVILASGERESSRQWWLTSYYRGEFYTSLYLVGGEHCERSIRYKQYAITSVEW